MSDLTADPTRPIARSRQIGPLGTLSRVAGGVVAIALPIALDGFSWWDAAIALVALPLIATAAAPLVTAVFRKLSPDALAWRHGPCSAPGCSLILLMVAVNDALVAPTTANGNVTIWVWLGASMLLAAARGYAGCEVLAVWNLVTGRRDQVGCLVYTWVDRAEARRGQRRSAASPTGTSENR